MSHLMMKVKTVPLDELVFWRIYAEFSQRHINLLQLERALDQARAAFNGAVGEFCEKHGLNPSVPFQFDTKTFEIKQDVVVSD